tara:strand:- start:829 stop:1128 length:300 start_codon:yes stop_codon:yes gene_type:complete
LPPEKFAEPLMKETTDPLSRTKLGLSEFISKTEFEKTFPFSEPGELSPDTDLLAKKYSFSVESISSDESMKLRIGTVRNSKQIVAARYFCTGIILDIQH